MKEDVSGAILVSISEDSQEAFRKLYDLLYPRIYRVSGYFVKSAWLREEIVSDVFLSLWKNRHTLAKIDNLEAYVFTIVRNQALFYIRQKKSDFFELDTAIEIVTDSSPESEIINSELKTAIETAINELPERCRLVFLLAKEEGLKYREIAHILSISEKTVNAQIVTAIKKLSESLQKYLTFLLTVL